MDAEIQINCKNCKFWTEANASFGRCKGNNISFTDTEDESIEVGYTEEVVIGQYKLTGKNRSCSDFITNDSN